jgi:predicted RNA binding protein with dsRBD fold (UPF0201 family)
MPAPSAVSDTLRRNITTIIALIRLHGIISTARNAALYSLRSQNAVIMRRIMEKQAARVETVSEWRTACCTVHGNWRSGVRSFAHGAVITAVMITS